MIFPPGFFPLHRFGNGLFACLVLTLSFSSLLAAVVGTVGGLVLELQGVIWTGSHTGCVVYYFSSSLLLRLDLIYFYFLEGLRNEEVLTLKCDSDYYIMTILMQPRQLPGGQPREPASLPTQCQPPGPCLRPPRPPGARPPLYSLHLSGLLTATSEHLHHRHGQSSSQSLSRY